jgi:hypothetical protein
MTSNLLLASHIPEVAQKLKGWTKSAENLQALLLEEDLLIVVTVAKPIYCSLTVPLKLKYSTNFL